MLAGLPDPSWRVREMAAKVAARHLVGDALPALAALATDPSSGFAAQPSER